MEDKGLQKDEHKAVTLDAQMNTDLKQQNIMDLFEFKHDVESGVHPKYVDKLKVDI